MKNFKKPFKAMTILVIISICGVAVWWATQTGEASNPRRVANFGMFGVTTDQFARLNVTNACTPVDPCRSRTLRLIFLDANGSSGGGGGADTPLTQTVVTLEPGRSAFLDVPGSLFVNESNRAQIRAVVEDLGAA